MKEQTILQVRDLNKIRRTEKQQDEMLEEIEKLFIDPEKLKLLLSRAKQLSDKALFDYYKRVKFQEEHNKKCREFRCEKSLSTTNPSFSFFMAYHNWYGYNHLGYYLPIGVTHFLIEHNHLILDHRIGIIFNENGGHLNER